MYFNGGDVTEEGVYANMWCNIAAANGSKDAKNYKGILVKQVTPQGFSKAQDLARECVKKDKKDGQSNSIHHGCTLVSFAVPSWTKGVAMSCWNEKRKHTQSDGKVYEGDLSYSNMYVKNYAIYLFGGITCQILKCVDQFLSCLSFAY